MYTDTLIVFHRADGDHVATVWHRGFPQGRQRRKQVAVYRLGKLGDSPSPLALLAALSMAMGGPPSYTV